MSSAPYPAIDPETELTLLEAAKQLGVTYTYLQNLLERESELGGTVTRRRPRGGPARCISRETYDRVQSYRDARRPADGWLSEGQLAERINRSRPTVKRWLTDAGIEPRLYDTPSGQRPHYPPSALKALQVRLPAVSPAGNWITQNQLEALLADAVTLPRLRAIFALPEFQALGQTRLDAYNHPVPHYPPITSLVVPWAIAAEDEPVIRDQAYLTHQTIAERIGWRLEEVIARTSSPTYRGLQRFSVAPDGQVTAYLPPSMVEQLPRLRRRLEASSRRRSLPSAAGWLTLDELVRQVGAPRYRTIEIVPRPEVQTLRELRVRSKRPNYYYAPAAVQAVRSIIATEDEPVIAEGSYRSLTAMATDIGCPVHWLIQATANVGDAPHLRFKLTPKGRLTRYLPAHFTALLRVRWQRELRSSIPWAGNWLTARQIARRLNITVRRTREALRLPELSQLGEERRSRIHHVHLRYPPVILEIIPALLAEQDAPTIAAGQYVTPEVFAKLLRCRMSWLTVQMIEGGYRSAARVRLHSDGSFELVYPLRLIVRLRRRWRQYRRLLDQPSTQQVLLGRRWVVPAAGWYTVTDVTSKLGRISSIRVHKALQHPQLRVLAEFRLTSEGRVRRHFPPDAPALVLRILAAEDEATIRDGTYLSHDGIARELGAPPSWVMTHTRGSRWRHARVHIAPDRRVHYFYPAKSVQKLQPLWRKHRNTDRRNWRPI